MEKTKTIIKPPSAIFFNMKELWQYAELFYFFTWRDIKIKYKQTVLGIVWAIIQPIAVMLLFTYVVGRNFKPETGNIRYEIFFLSGFVLWSFFYSAVSTASESLIEQSNMIRKIYFPRIILVGSATLAALFDLFITLILFFVFCMLYRQPVNWSFVFLCPISIGLTGISAIGIGALLSALNVRFRDFRYITPFLLQFLFFATQIFYSIDGVQQQWLKNCLAVNPVNGAVEILRYALSGVLDSNVVLISLVSGFLIAISGIFYFKKSEAYFADLV